ncbi:hypothetical protein CVS47_03024 [Microbacterium lemovicicum]|uniref:DUF4407 domain-containing protein n=1 Tax=Microbacterium lemovicicum TaxID=1072463 RepID=A0A3S9WE50_9MICO|nr:DUF4407 domain-containing protein [Microbacterium lemovicicum]AZS38368.1 hypothetical protein CVS47_03024 [Microbacterium lemovicicum]
MSFSAHRPGRFGSDGRIDLDAPDETDDAEPQYLSDLRADADDDHSTHAWGAPGVGDEQDAAQHPEPVVEAAEEPAPTRQARAPREPREPRAPRPPRQRRVSPPRRRLPLGRRIAVLGGADADVLADVPEETSRFVQMFFVLLGTALVSALSMVFALVTGVRISVWLAIPLALVWALLIFNLDRFLTSTMRSTRNVGRLIGLALPRVIMAALIGIVVAEPLVLQVFANDIAREVNSTNVVQAQTDQNAVTDGPEKQALDAASAQVSALENQAATGIVEGTSSTSAEVVAAQQSVDQLTAQLTAQQGVIDQARLVYQCELTGAGAGTVTGCTGVAGEGTSSDAAQAQLTQAQSAYDALSAQLTQAQSALSAASAASTGAAAASGEQNKQQAEDQLPAARAQYDGALAAYNDRAAAIASGNAGAVGLLSQIGALERLSQKEPTLLWAHWLIAALFFMIELLPVLVKVLTSFGGPSLYEKAEALRTQVALDRVTTRTFHRRAEALASTSTS